MAHHLALLGDNVCGFHPAHDIRSAERSALSVSSGVGGRVRSGKERCRHISWGDCIFYMGPPRQPPQEEGKMLAGAVMVSQEDIFMQQKSEDWEKMRKWKAGREKQDGGHWGGLRLRLEPPADASAPLVRAVWFPAAKRQKQPTCPSTGYMDKQNEVCPCRISFSF